MRSGSPNADIGVADLPCEYRLAELERPLADLNQAVAVVDAFHECGDDLDLRALDQVGDPVEQVEIGLVAGRNGVVAADAVIGGHGNDAETEAAALGDHRHRPRLERPQFRRAAEANAGVVLQVQDAKAVGSHHPHVGLARRRDTSPPAETPLFAHLAETAGQHQRERDPGLPALLDGIGHSLCGQRDQGHVARLRHRQEIGIAGETFDVVVFGIDWVDRAGVAEIGEQTQRLAANAGRVIRYADDRNSRAGSGTATGRRGIVWAVLVVMTRCA